MAVGATIAIAGVGVVGFRWWLTRAPDAITVGRAVDRYRSSTSSSTAGTASGAVPAPGVYVYLTAGHETVDALGGDTHEYPSTTTITVTPKACGFRMTWTPMTGRSDTTDVCSADNGLATTRTIDVHEFFRMSQTETFTCADPSWWLPPKTSSAWTTTCISDGGRITTRQARVIGHEQVTVGDASQPSVHVAIDDVISGSSTGTTSTDLWLDPTTGLLLRERSSAKTANDTAIGRVTFTEQLDLLLQTTTPQE